MWTTKSEQLDHDRGLRCTLHLDSRPAAFTEVLSAFRDEADLRSLFNSVLADAPYTAFRWETPPVTAATSGRPFEFVILDSPGLDRRPDPKAFAEHFGGAGTAEVVEFRNLGGDAILIVPRLLEDPAAYGHLAAFVRLAPEHQRHALWQQVGEAMNRRLGTRPVWLSTAGAGVSWLHVRLDDRPKYYGFAPYCRCQET
jgi:hypothetical protein